MTGSRLDLKRPLFFRLLVPMVVLAGGLGYLYLSKFADWRFSKPWTLLLVCPVVLLGVILRFKPRFEPPGLFFPSASFLSQRTEKNRVISLSKLIRLPEILILVASVMLLVAVAKPVSKNMADGVVLRGIDIAIALDLSKSMEANDLSPNRLTAAKDALAAFIKRRRGDRIALVVFADQAFTHVPLTVDYHLLRNLLKELHLGTIDGKGTAIGNALGLSLARLRKSDAKSKVVLLVTDGDNNSGNLAPMEAAKMAEEMNVAVFTVLIGPKGDMINVRDAFGRAIRVKNPHPLNPKLLEDIAQKTGGQAFHVENEAELQTDLQRILNRLEKDERSNQQSGEHQLYQPFAASSFLLLAIAALLKITLFKEFP